MALYGVKWVYYMYNMRLGGDAGQFVEMNRRRIGHFALAWSFRAARVALGQSALGMTRVCPSSPDVCFLCALN